MTNSDPNRSELPLPRWLTFLVGLFLAPIVLLCVLGSFFLLLEPSPGKELLVSIVATIMLLLSIWLGTVVLRLILGKPRITGGLFSPTALRSIASVFLLIPIITLLTGAFFDRPILHLIQSIVYLVIFSNFWQQASRRQASLGGNSDRDDA